MEHLICISKDNTLFELTQNHATFEHNLEKIRHFYFILQLLHFYSDDIEGSECLDAKQKLQLGLDY